MKNSLSTGFLCRFSVWHSTAQNTTFMRLAQVPGLNFGLSFTETSDGGMVGTGQDDGAGGHGICDLYVYKVDECGITEWYKRYGGGGEDGGKYVTQLSDGGYAVAALTRSTGAGGYDNWLLRLDGQGNLLWSKTFGTGAEEHGRCVAEAPNGDLILTGFVGARAGVLFRVDATGNTVWQKQIGLTNSTANYIEAFPNGDLLLIGDFSGPYGLRDTYVARLSSAGDLIWAKQLGTGGEDGFDWDTGGRITSDGFVLSATMSGFGTGEDMTLSKFDPFGNILWKKRTYGPAQDKAHFVNQTTDGGFLQSGFTTSWGFGSADVLVNRFDSNGNHLWSRIYGGPAIDKGWGVQESADDGYLISALTTSFGAWYYDPMFIKTDSVGMVENCPNVGTPPVTVVDAGYSISNLTFTISDVDYFTGDYSPSAIDIVPTDQLVCFDCTNEPQFIISDSTLCAGEPLYLINQTTVGLICAQEWFIQDSLGASVSTLPGEDTAVYIFEEHGFYNIVLNASCGGITNSDTLTITVYPNPEAGFVFNDTCINTQPVSITDTSTFFPVQWDWDFGDLSTGNGQTVGHTYSDTGYFDIELMVENLWGCRDTLTKTIDIHDSPLSEFSVNDTCFGGQHLFSDLSTSNDGAINSYEWNYGDGQSGQQQNPTHTYSASDTYDVELIVTTEKGCKDTIVQQVTSFVLPQAAFSATVSCIYDPTILQETTTVGDNPMVSWNWNLLSGAVQLNGPSVQHPFPSEGSFPVQLIVEDAAGCIDSIDQTITVNPRPLIDISVSDTCQLIANQFINSSSIVSGSIDSISWNMGDLTNYSSISPMHIYSDPGVYDVTLYMESDQGCDSDTAFQVEAYPNPTAGLITSNVCDSTDVPFEETSQVSLPGVLQASNWNLGNGISFQDTALVSYSYGTYGSYDVELTALTQHGCRDTLLSTVYVHPLLVADISFTNICEDDSVLFNDQSLIAAGNIAQWDWSFGNGILYSGQDPDQQQYPLDSIFAVSLLVTSDSGCTDLITDTIEVYPVPIANFSFDSICFPEAIQFTDLSDPNGTYLITQYAWSFSDGQESNDQSPSIAFNEYGAYSGSLLVANQWGCKGDTTIGDALVHPLPIANYGSNFGHCEDETAWFSDSSQIEVLSDDVIISWVYDLANGQYINSPNGEHLYAGHGIYPVQLSIETNNGCKDSLTLPVEVYPRPDVYWTAEPINGCVPLAVQFTDSSVIPAPYSIAKWEWDLGDAITAEVSDPHYVYNPTGLAPNDSAVYSISLTTTSAMGCERTLSVDSLIVAHPLPEAFFRTDPNKVATIIEPIFRFTDLSTENVVYWNWNYGDGAESFDQSPTHEYPDTGRYVVELYVETGFGCADRVEYTVIVEPTFTFYIPNAFSPDSDGINEVFNGYGTGYVDFEMRIYDRWGELLFETANPDMGWDGTYKNRLVEQGEYVYSFQLIDHEGLKHTYHGGVLLLK